MQDQENVTMGNLRINEIELFNEPRESVISQYSIPDGEPEMSEFESGFLCGIIKKHRPNKIVEVGVAGGATTAIILECLEELKIDYSMSSIDFAEQFYKDPTKQSGYLAKQIIQRRHLEKKHHFYLGDIAYNYMEEIGANIDCIVLDTMHLLPGELLDIITLLPFVKKGGVVVMHDIAWNLYSDVKSGYATGAVMASVAGIKYINYDFTRNELYPNIGAFIVDDDSIGNIGNLFLLLFVTWRYIPDAKQLSAYRKAINELYGDAEARLFDKALELNGRTMNYKTRIKEALKIVYKGHLL